MRSKPLADGLQTSLVLAKGNAGAVGLSLRWLEMFCDARTSQFFMAPHHMQDLLSAALAIIIRQHLQAPTDLIDSPQAQLKFQFPPDMFPQKELTSLTVDLPWGSILSVWDAL